MAKQTRGHEVSCSPCWAHGSNEIEVDYLLQRPAFLRLVVPGPMIHKLPEELDWWLGAILL
jgi:hypothetical protein